MFESLKREDENYNSQLGPKVVTKETRSQSTLATLGIVSRLHPLRKREKAGQTFLRLFLKMHQWKYPIPQFPVRNFLFRYFTLSVSREVTSFSFFFLVVETVQSIESKDPNLLTEDER